MLRTRTLYRIAIGWLLFLCLGLGFIFLYQPPKPSLKPVANALLLTDCCLTTEARYLRHFTTFEPIAVFQDLPGYHEHAPASPFIYPMMMHQQIQAK
jgi:hypothetical protein